MDFLSLRGFRSRSSKKESKKDAPPSAPMPRTNASDGKERAKVSARSNRDGSSSSSTSRDKRLGGYTSDSSDDGSASSGAHCKSRKVREGHKQGGSAPARGGVLSLLRKEGPKVEGGGKGRSNMGRPKTAGALRGSFGSGTFRLRGREGRQGEEGKGGGGRKKSQRQDERCGERSRTAADGKKKEGAKGAAVARDHDQGAGGVGGIVVQEEEPKTSLAAPELLPLQKGAWKDAPSSDQGVHHREQAATADLTPPLELGSLPPAANAGVPQEKEASSGLELVLFQAQEQGGPGPAAVQSSPELVPWMGQGGETDTSSEGSAEGAPAADLKADPTEVVKGNLSPVMGTGTVVLAPGPHSLQLHETFTKGIAEGEQLPESCMAESGPVGAFEARTPGMTPAEAYCPHKACDGIPVMEQEVAKACIPSTPDEATSGDIGSELASGDQSAKEIYAQVIVSESHGDHNAALSGRSSVQDSNPQREGRKLTSDGPASGSKVVRPRASSTQKPALEDIELLVSPCSPFPTPALADPFACKSRLEKIGEGSVAEVHRLDVAGTRESLALKFVDTPSKAQRVRVLLEFAWMDSLGAKCESILRPYYVQAKGEGRESQMCVSMPYCEGTLYDYVEARGGVLAERLPQRHGQFSGLPEREALALLGQMAAAVAHCHRNGLCHADVKPENFLLTSFPRPPKKAQQPQRPGTSSGARGQRSAGVRNIPSRSMTTTAHSVAASRTGSLATPARPQTSGGNPMASLEMAVPPGAVKLTDFGLAVRLDDPRAHQWSAGTTGYMAPEVLRNRNGVLAPSVPFGPESDVWSLGATLFFMLTGCAVEQDMRPGEKFHASKWKVVPPVGRSRNAGRTKIDMDDRREREKLEEDMGEVEGGPEEPVFPLHLEGWRWKTISVPTKSLLRRMLHADPSRRPTAEELRERFLPLSTSTASSTSRAGSIERGRRVGERHTVNTPRTPGSERYTVNTPRTLGSERYTVNTPRTPGSVASSTRGRLSRGETRGARSPLRRATTEHTGARQPWRP